jgi:DnaK suppressor protein
MNTLTHGMTTNRYQELRRILEERRDEMAGEVKDKIRLARAEGGQMSTRRVADACENSETDIQNDIKFALIQMKAETLTKISTALGLVEEGAYGYCYECGDEIGEGRLRALPFAARCKDCEEVRENEQNRARVLEYRSKAVSLLGTPSV